MPHRPSIAFVLVAALAASMGDAMGDDETDRPVAPPSPQPVAGSLVIGGGGWIRTALLKKFLELGGGPNAKLVIVTTASVYAGTPESDARLWFWREQPTASFRVLHTRSREEANRPEFSEMLTDATAVWFVGGNQNWVAETYLGTLTESRLHGVLQRGGVIGGTSAGAAIMSRVMIGGGYQEPLLRTGLGFLPYAIVDQHFLRRQREPRLLSALRQHPGHVGIGIDEDTALCVRGRECEVWGDSDVAVCLAAAGSRETQWQRFRPGEKFDLIGCVRAAQERVRMLAGDQPNSQPRLSNGTLILAGGRPAESSVAEKFIAASGGKDSKIVIVARPHGAGSSDAAKWLKEAGANDVAIVQPETPVSFASQETKDLIEHAGGVWISDGPAHGVIESVVDAAAHSLLKSVLDRGGAVGGAAAGAWIHGERLAAGRSAESHWPSGEGYVRGLGLLPRVIIQNAANERRPAQADDGADLVSMRVDESSAVVVQGQTLEVMGDVSVEWPAQNRPAALAEVVTLRRGDRFDLVERRRIGPSSPEAP